MDRRLFMLTPAALTGCFTSHVQVFSGKFPAHPKFLIAGQSNGMSPPQDGAKPAWSRTGRVTVSDIYHGMVRRIPTKDKPMDGSLCWIELGDLMERDVTFVNISRGSQSSERWVSKWLHELMNPALRAERFDAVLWLGGESDWFEKRPADQIYSNMQRMIFSARAKQPGLPWFVALNSYRTSRDNPVRQAQQRLIDEGIVFAGPDLDPIRDNPAWVEKSGTEYAGDGLRVVGRYWYDALKPYL